MNKQLIEKLLVNLLDDDSNEDTKNCMVYPWHVGKNYFIRTVTMHIVGKLMHVTDKEMLLDNASWIADSGRFHTALKTGKFEEIEPFIDEVIVNRASVIDATEFNHALPSEQK